MSGIKKTYCVLFLCCFLLVGISLPGQSISINPADGEIPLFGTKEIVILLDTTTTTGTQNVTAVQAYLDISDNLEIIDGAGGVELYNQVWQICPRQIILKNRLELAMGSRSGGCRGKACEVARFFIRVKKAGNASLRLIPVKTKALTPLNEEIIRGNVISGEYNVLNNLSQSWAAY
jgi:hypothetical protein